MSQFIEELGKEHDFIIEQLAAVKRMGVHTMEGRSQLNKTKNELLKHLKREDEGLYPSIRRAAGKNEKLKSVADTFEDEMKEISVFCIEFFKKYSIGGGGIEFFRDCDKLYRSLESRIQKEEEILFAVYEELHTKTEISGQAN
ncbi:MAG: hemerythrin domain-containing protein [bacterium]|nr:hemerythrin domain-containing protein [bacterium]